MDHTVTDNGVDKGRQPHLEFLVFALREVEDVRQTHDALRGVLDVFPFERVHFLRGEFIHALRVAGVQALSKNA